MLRTIGASSLFVTLALLVSSAQAEEKTTSKTTAPQEIRRDSKGITGISPFWETVGEGDSFFLAQNFEEAAKSYQNAITQSPKDPVGHLRMAEVSLKTGALPQAQDFILAAIRFSEEDFRRKAQSMFLLALVHERQKNWDSAIAAWKDYMALEGQRPQKEGKKGSARGPQPVTVYVKTAEGRISALEKRIQLEADYTPVRERIQKNVDAADDATGAGSAK